MQDYKTNVSFFKSLCVLLAEFYVSVLCCYGLYNSYISQQRIIHNSVMHIILLYKLIMFNNLLKV